MKHKNLAFHRLADATGFGTCALARFLRVKTKTICDWRTGRRKAPKGALAELRHHLETRDDTAGAA